MKFFKETMGVSFIQYLNDYRLDIAAELLTTTTVGYIKNKKYYQNRYFLGETPYFFLKHLLK